MSQEVNDATVLPVKGWAGQPQSDTAPRACDPVEDPAPLLSRTRISLSSLSTRSQWKVSLLPEIIGLRAGEPAQFRTGESAICGEPQIRVFGQASHVGDHTRQHQPNVRAAGDNLTCFARHNARPVEPWRHLAHAAASRDSVVGS